MTKDQLVEEMNKVFGTGAVKLGNDPSLFVKYLPTGVIPFDVLLKGGIPRGRWTEVFGDFSTLKSYVAYCWLGKTQRNGGKVALVDNEHSYDPEWYEFLGGDSSKLKLCRPETGEEAIGEMESYIRDGYSAVVWDSVAATLPKDEAEKDPRKAVQPARLAALMSAGLRRLTAANRDTAILCLNQTRTNVGVVFGSSESIPGGKSLPFYASYRISMRKAGRITEESEMFDGEKMVKVKNRTHMKIKITLEKSKLNAPDREAWLVFDLRTGRPDDISFLISQGLAEGYLYRTDKGRWSWDGDNKTYTLNELRTNTPQEDWDWLAGELMA